MKVFIDNQQERNGSKSCHPLSWSSVPSKLYLTRDEVHVWCVNLDVLDLDINCLKHILSKEENDKADSFHFKDDRENYIGRHVMLRKILCRYLSLEPDKINFRYGFHGKPSLSNYFKADKIYFNLSHSKGLVLYAMTRGRKVGVDVERVTSGIMDEQFISYVFSQKELSTIQSLPMDMRTNALFRSWTRKEAFVKALGQGLSYDLKRIDVSAALGEKSIISNQNCYAHSSCCWSLRDIELGPGYAGSIVLEGYNWALKCWKLECDFN